MSFVARAIMLLIVSFSPAPVAAAGLRSTLPVRTVTIGRPFLIRTTTMRGVSTSVRMVAVARGPTSTATAGGLFGLSKGSPNSGRM